MSTFQVDKLLYQVTTDRTTFERFVSDPESLLDGYELSNAERAAVLGRDLRALSGVSANGYLVLGFAARLGVYPAAAADGTRSGGH